MRRTLMVVTAMLVGTGLCAAAAFADKGGVPHEGSQGKGRPAAAPAPAAPVVARRPAKPKHGKTAPARHQPAAKPRPAHPAKPLRPAAKAAPSPKPKPASAQAPAAKPAHGQPKTTICHHTGSQSNPWVTITIAAPALKAHARHGDLIPAPSGGCPKPVPVTAPAVAMPPLLPEGSVPAAAAPAGDSAPVVAASRVQTRSLPVAGLGPVRILRLPVARTASRGQQAGPRGAVLAETVSSPATPVAATAAARRTNGGGLPFTGMAALLVALGGAAALLAGVALRRASLLHH